MKYLMNSTTAKEKVKQKVGIKGSVQESKVNEEKVAWLGSF